MEHFPTINRLHTDVLEEKYGPIHPEILKHNRKMRSALLVDMKGIARTYALTLFPADDFPSEIRQIADEIKQGGSIGKTFREYGYEIRKNVVAVRVIDIPHWLKDAFKVDDDKAKARFSEFLAKRPDGEPILYATVLEVYTPDFRKAEINAADRKQINPTFVSMVKNGIGAEIVWERITSGNDWSDMGERYEQARKESESEIEDIQRRAFNYIRNA